MWSGMVLIVVLVPLFVYCVVSSCLLTWFDGAPLKIFCWGRYNIFKANFLQR